MNQNGKRRRPNRRATGGQSIDWRLKRYGRILGKEVERQLFAFREFSREGQELRALLMTEDAAKFWRELAKSPTWAHYYQESFTTLIARFVALAKAGDVVRSMAQREFPADHVDDLEAHLGEHDPPSECPELIGLLFALMANLEAIALFSCTMNELLLRAQSHACFQSLARAASIDVGVLSLPNAQFAMKAMQLVGETELLSEFLGAVAQGPHKGRIPYQELRWMEYLLREQGAFRACSQQEIYDLLARDLKVYGDDREHPDAKKALFALFRKWRLELAN